VVLAAKEARERRRGSWVSEHSRVAWSRAYPATARLSISVQPAARSGQLKRHVNDTANGHGSGHGKRTLNGTKGNGKQAERGSPPETFYSVDIGPRRDLRPARCDRAARRTAANRRGSHVLALADQGARPEKRVVLGHSSDSQRSLGLQCPRATSVERRAPPLPLR